MTGGGQLEGEGGGRAAQALGVGPGGLGGWGGVTPVGSTGQISHSRSSCMGIKQYIYKGSLEVYTFYK